MKTIKVLRPQFRKTSKTPTLLSKTEISRSEAVQVYFSSSNAVARDQKSGSCQIRTREKSLNLKKSTQASMPSLKLPTRQEVFNYNNFDSKQKAHGCLYRQKCSGNHANQEYYGRISSNQKRSQKILAIRKNRVWTDQLRKFSILTPKTKPVIATPAQVKNLTQQVEPEQPNNRGPEFRGKSCTYTKTIDIKVVPGESPYGSMSEKCIINPAESLHRLAPLTRPSKRAKTLSRNQTGQKKGQKLLSVETQQEFRISGANSTLQKKRQYSLTSIGPIKSYATFVQFKSEELKQNLIKIDTRKLLVNQQLDKQISEYLKSDFEKEKSSTVQMAQEKTELKSRITPIPTIIEYADYGFTCKQEQQKMNNKILSPYTMRKRNVSRGNLIRIH